MSGMRFATAAIHRGQDPDPGTGAVIPPIFATSTFAQREPGVTRGYDYTRSGNPNFSNLQEVLAELEGGRHATVFSSGMAAITAVISTLATGDRVIAEENIYGCTYRIFDRVFAKFGVRVEYADLSDPANYGLIAAAPPALVWIESPTNPLLKVLDIAAIAGSCREVGVPLVVDNTFASPFFQRPLALGADISLASTTKYLNGHSDCLGGVVCTNQKDWQEKMLFAQKAVGLNPSPFDAWLVQRGVKTLELRMRQHHENALAVARFLESHPAVEFVRFPYLESHPQFELARRQMSGGSGIVTAGFRLSREQTVALISSLRYFALAESLGGIESLVCHPASMTHASIPRPEREAVGIGDSLVRFSVGIEDAEDLVEDLESALAAIDALPRGESDGAV